MDVPRTLKGEDTPPRKLMPRLPFLDIVIVLIVTAIVHAVSIHIDLFELIAHHSRKAESLELDELLPTLFVLALLSSLLAIRWWQKAESELTARTNAENRLLKSNERLRRIARATIEAGARGSGMRDPYTANHQERVTRLATAIAAEMSLDENRILGLRYAAAIHDIGKIIVPMDILIQPTRLSPLEFELIQEHPLAAYRMIKDIDFPWPVAEIILQHHERLDGSGYPRGLDGKQILLEARILAVADVVEAMSSDRPYRPALGIKKALQEITHNSGKLYDPAAVEACLVLFMKKNFTFQETSPQTALTA